MQPLIWAVIGIIVLGVALGSTVRLLMKPKSSTDPTVVGALVLLKENDMLGDVPLYTYVGDARSRSALISVGLTGGPKDTTVRILFSHARDGKSYSTSANVSIVGEPRVIGSDIARYSFHQSHERQISAIDAVIAANARVSISVAVTDPPEADTYTTCRMAFAPPLSGGIITAAGEGGFRPVMPVMANIQRAPDATGFLTTGGRRVHDHIIGSITEASYLDAHDPILRAFWTDESKRSWQNFWLFFRAAASALGVAMIFEALRPFIERL